MNESVVSRSTILIFTLFTLTTVYWFFGFMSIFIETQTRDFFLMCVTSCLLLILVIFNKKRINKLFPSVEMEMLK